ncbi:MAG TPA: ABC transporter ATP-binding protein [Candidatus Thermoplasmatota archaeon]|nr:ABC transporter ATP-binding protein [Candidatus Thermoplasmatota archaeon]
MPGIEVKDLRKRFGDQEVLKGVSFSAGPGDIVAIIGPSGCGKTTLLRCILGELNPDGGRILIGGDDVTRVPVESRAVGIVYQSYALFPHMTVEENVGYGLRVAKVPKERAKARVKEMLELVRLTGKEDKYPHRLSGGERQRVALARALAVEPRVLLLDEAFAALDATTRLQVVQEVRTIVKRLGLTTLFITHDQEEAFLLSQQVVVLNEGNVVADGAPETIIGHPDPFLQQFVKMAFFRRGRVEEAGGVQVISLPDGTRFPVEVPGLVAGDEVHVMVKKGAGPDGTRVEVHPIDRR